MRRKRRIERKRVECCDILPGLELYTLIDGAVMYIAFFL